MQLRFCDAPGCGSEDSDTSLVAFRMCNSCSRELASCLHSFALVIGEKDLVSKGGTGLPICSLPNWLGSKKIALNGYLSVSSPSLSSESGNCEKSCIAISSKLCLLHSPVHRSSIAIRHVFRKVLYTSSLVDIVRL